MDVYRGLKTIVDVPACLKCGSHDQPQVVFISRGHVVYRNDVAVIDNSEDFYKTYNRYTMEVKREHLIATCDCGYKVCVETYENRQTKG